VVYCPICWSSVPGSRSHDPQGITTTIRVRWHHRCGPSMPIECAHVAQLCAWSSHGENVR